MSLFESQKNAGHQSYNPNKRKVIQWVIGIIDGDSLNIDSIQQQKNSQSDKSEVPR